MSFEFCSLCTDKCNICEIIFFYITKILFSMSHVLDIYVIETYVNNLDYYIMQSMNTEYHII